MEWTLVINCLCFLILVILWALLTPMSWVWFHHSPVLTVPGAFRSVFHWRRQQHTSCNPLFIYTVTPLPKTKKLSRQQNQRKQYRCCSSQPSSSETIQDTQSVNQTKPNQKPSLLEMRTRQPAKLHDLAMLLRATHTMPGLSQRYMNTAQLNPLYLKSF